MFAKGPAVRKKIIVNDEMELEVRSRWYAVKPDSGGTKVILSVRKSGEVLEARAIWAISDAPLWRSNLRDALEEARKEANWAVWEYLYFLSLALRRKTQSLLDDLLLHYRVYSAYQNRQPMSLLSGLELAGEFAKLVNIAYIFIHCEIVARRHRDYDEFAQFVGEKILEFADDKEAEVFDLRPILQAKSLAEAIQAKTA
jgi:hypothetical protein